ncbi:MAG: hypothetical protein E7318_03710 [Clostridiales bacterium]|nr:hypothetical protein [Clostridiales bacterium]
MSEIELTLGQKREKALAAMDCIVNILQKQKAGALINAEKSQEQMKEMYQAENRKSWLGFGFKLVLNLLAMVFLKVDHRFLNFGKEAPNQNLKDMSETFVTKVSRGYEDTFAMLDGMIAQVKRSDSAAELCYEKMLAVATNRSNAAMELLSMGAEMEVFIRSRAREMMEALRKEDKTLADIRNGVYDIVYPAE